MRTNTTDMHHIIYDENNRKRFRIPLNERAHRLVHGALQRYGFVIPHINVGKGLPKECFVELEKDLKVDLRVNIKQDIKEVI